MNWQSMEEFLNMGGYAVYVWGSFGVSAAVMAFEVMQLRLRARRALVAARRGRP